MIRAVGLYRWKENARFDHAYYSTDHMDLTRRLLAPLGLIRLESDRGITSDPPAEGQMVAISHAFFNSIEEAQTALSAVGDELMADVSKYTNLQPEVHMTTVTEHSP